MNNALSSALGVESRTDAALAETAAIDTESLQVTPPRVTQFADAASKLEERVSVITSVLQPFLYESLREVVLLFMRPTFSLKNTLNVSLKNIYTTPDNTCLHSIISLGERVAYYANRSMCIWDAKTAPVYFADSCYKHTPVGTISALATGNLLLRGSHYISLWLLDNDSVHRTLFWFKGRSSSGVELVVETKCIPGSPEPAPEYPMDATKIPWRSLCSIITVGDSEVLCHLDVDNIVVLLDIARREILNQWWLGTTFYTSAPMRLTDSGSILVTSHRVSYLLDRDGSISLAPMDLKRYDPEPVWVASETVVTETESVVVSGRVRVDCRFVIHNHDIGMERLALERPSWNDSERPAYSSIAPIHGDKLVAVSTHKRILSLFE